MSVTPQQPPMDPERSPPPLPVGYQTPQAQPSSMTGRATYNVVSDTVTGVNIRLRDNIAQLISVLVCALIGTGIGYLMADEPDARAMAMIGAVGGMIAGIILSGAFLAVYRAVRHIIGKHD